VAHRVLDLLVAQVGHLRLPRADRYGKEFHSSELGPSTTSEKEVQYGNKVLARSGAGLRLVGGRRCEVGQRRWRSGVRIRT
jgi:hypothetical protein